MSETLQHTRPIVLVGLSGSGKSTVAPLLAARLGFPLRDTDVSIEAAAGVSIPMIFAAEGEAGFRDRESLALAAALSGGPCVVATGAGIVLREANRAQLRARALVVWLDAPDETLLARLRAHAEERPLLRGDDPEGRLAGQRAARAALYADVAQIVIATADLAPDAICEAILRAAADASVAA
jgi:shikimate kinase